MEVTKYEPGTFSWVDYSAKDLDGARAFYGALFDWTWFDVPTGGEPYVMAQIGGKDVAALMPQPEQEQQGGAPAHWNSYVTVDDVDATTAQVKELGGQVVLEPRDIPPGRFATVVDPQGGAFSVIRLKGEAG